MLQKRKIDVTKKNKINWLIAIISILIAVSGLSMSVLALTASYDVLNIKGYAQINTSRWDIHFENLSKVTLSGLAKELTSPTINEKSTEIGSFRIQFNSTEDTASYTFDVVNAGNMDAVITTISILNPNCETVETAGYQDALTVCKNFSYELTYSNGDEIRLGDILEKGSRKTLKITLHYSGNDWPINTVDVSNISAMVIYSQK